MTPERLDELCPDWREREAFLCGPAGLLEAMSERWARDGDPARLHVEHFQPDEHVGDGERGAGGTIRLCASGHRRRQRRRAADPARGRASRRRRCPSAAAWASATAASGGCARASVRDLRTGRVHGQPGELLRTCINAPEGAVEIDL